MTAAQRLKEEAILEVRRMVTKNILVMEDSATKIAMVTGLTEKEIEEIKKDIDK